MGSKIILFIVEGVSDDTALGATLNRLLKKHIDKNIRDISFHLINGDITTGIGHTKNNVKEEVVKEIKNFLSKYRLKKEDIYKVIQLTDTDGAYAPDDVIKSHEMKKITYNENEIFCKEMGEKIDVNKTKSRNLNELSSTGKIFKDIEYEIYYFSCNLEHVTSNNQNAEKSEKDSLAEEFMDKYSDDLDGFVDFFKEQELFTGETYRETWDFIKIGTNSLKRYTNFYIFIDKLINNDI